LEIYDIHAHIAGVEFESNGNYLSRKILRSVPFLFFTRSCGFSSRDLREPGIDRFIGVVLQTPIAYGAFRGNDRILIRWNDPCEGGPPEGYFIPKQRTERRFW